MRPWRQPAAGNCRNVPDESPLDFSTPLFLPWERAQSRCPPALRAGTSGPPDGSARGLRPSLLGGTSLSPGGRPPQPARIAVPTATAAPTSPSPIPPPLSPTGRSLPSASPSSSAPDIPGGAPSAHPSTQTPAPPRRKRLAAALREHRHAPCLPVPVRPTNSRNANFARPPAERPPAADQRQWNPQLRPLQPLRAIGDRPTSPRSLPDHRAGLRSALPLVRGINRGPPAGSHSSSPPERCTCRFRRPAFLMSILCRKECITPIMIHFLCQFFTQLLINHCLLTEHCSGNKLQSCGVANLFL